MSFLGLEKEAILIKIVGKVRQTINAEISVQLLPGYCVRLYRYLLFNVIVNCQALTWCFSTFIVF